MNKVEGRQAGTWFQIMMGQDHYNMSKTEGKQAVCDSKRGGAKNELRHCPQKLRPSRVLDGTFWPPWP